jgi:hypothetical protein
MAKPLTPPDCDLQDSKFMPLYVQAMLNSSFNAMSDDTAWRAGVTLWMKAWYQVPAASLPNGDDELCNMAGLGRDTKTWKRIKAKALRGFVEANDGRLYHPVLAEGALEMWINMLLARISSGTGNAKRWKTTFDPAPIEADISASYALLKALNPRADAVLKIDRRNAVAPKPDDGGGPGGIPANNPGGMQSGVPHQSQPKPEPEPVVIDGGVSARDDLGWPMAATQWADDLMAATQCADPTRDIWPRQTAPVLVGWHEIDRFEWRDVVAGIRIVVAQGTGPPASWKYYAKAIARARQDRLQPTPEPVNDQRRQAYKSTAERNQDSTIAAFRNVFGRTSDSPDEPFSASG